jgi:hypothetical protein
LALLAMAAAMDQPGVRARCLLAARPSEYYYATYSVENDLPRLLGREKVGTFSSTAAAKQDILVTDELTAAALQIDSLAVGADPLIVSSDAAGLARLSARLMQDDPAIAISPAHAVPVYIKDDLEYRKSGSASR